MKIKGMWCCASLIAIGLGGCDFFKNLGDTSPGDNTVYSNAQTAPSSSDAQAPGQVPTIAFINSVPISKADLETPLYEASGGEVLTEVVMDRLVSQQLQERKLTITPDMIESEKQLLLANLNADPNMAQQLLNELRDRRGLGEVRFKNLLSRNAGLRLLVQERVKITEIEVNKEYMRLYGSTYELRLIVTATHPAAAEVINRAKAGEAFSDLAVKMSTDISKAQGGLLSPISPVDDTYPQAIRDVMEKLKVGQISDPIALEHGFAVIKLERIVDGTMPKRDDVQKDLEARVRVRVERLLIEQEARTLLRGANVTILNPALQKSWDFQRQWMTKGQ